MKQAQSVSNNPLARKRQKHSTLGQEVAFLFNRHLEIIWISPNLFSLAGWTPLEVIKSKITSLLHSNNQESFLQACKRLQQGDLVTQSSQAYEVLKGILIQHRQGQWLNGTFVLAPSSLDNDHVDTIFGLWLPNDHDFVTLPLTKSHYLQQTLTQQLLFLYEQLLVPSSLPLEETIQKTLKHMASWLALDGLALISYEGCFPTLQHHYQWPSRLESAIDLSSSLFLDTNEEDNDSSPIKPEEIIRIDSMNQLPKDHPLYSSFKALGIDSYFSIPLTSHGLVKGALKGYRLQPIEASYQEELASLEIYGHYLLSTLLFIIETHKNRQNEAWLVLEKNLYKTALLSVGDGVVATDINGKILVFNKAASKLTGWRPEDALFRQFEEVCGFLHEYSQQCYENLIQKVLDSGMSMKFEEDTLLRSFEQKLIPIELSVAPIRNEHEEMTGVIVVMKDISDKKQSQDEIRYLSIHDSLTGVYNRRFFDNEMKRLDHEKNLPITIMFGDFNCLKLINDTFGHAAGDEMLLKTFTAMKTCLRKQDVLARYGGDESVFLLPNTDKEGAEKLIQRMQLALKQQTVRGLSISVAFGYETKRNPTESLPLLFKKAEDYMYNQKIYEGSRIRSQMIHDIIGILFSKNSQEHTHAKRVSKICYRMGQAMNLSEGKLKKLKLLGLLHDIGKVAIADDIIYKQGPLNDKESCEMRRHAEIGYRMLSRINEMYDISEWILSHHERYDGSGYPRGLKEKQIPLFSRICAIADVYDALTSERSYKPAISKEAAKQELLEQSGKLFDPNLIEIFVNQVLPNLD